MKTKQNKEYKMGPKSYSGFTNNHSSSTPGNLWKRIYLGEKKCTPKKSLLSIRMCKNGLMSLEWFVASGGGLFVGGGSTVVHVQWVWVNWSWGEGDDLGGHLTPFYLWVLVNCTYPGAMKDSLSTELAKELFLHFKVLVTSRYLNHFSCSHISTNMLKVTLS